jgi:serine/threonine protein kinase
MQTKIASLRKFLIPSILAISTLFLVVHFYHRSFSPVKYPTSLGRGSEAAAYPAILKVHHGHFDLKKYIIDEATVLEAVKGPYVVKMYGQYTDNGGLKVLVLEKVAGRPIFRPAEVYTASLAIKMRVLKEFLYALKDIHTKGKISFVYYFRILSQ